MYFQLDLSATCVGSTLSLLQADHFFVTYTIDDAYWLRARITLFQYCDLKCYYPYIFYILLLLKDKGDVSPENLYY
jgi:hypothetical protein